MRVPAANGTPPLCTRVSDYSSGCMEAYGIVLEVYAQVYV